ncbi:MAG: MFS transporter [Endomicrobiales bacterium]
MSIKSTFRAFKNRNYWMFFVGQGTSLIGTWMQYIATSWLVYRLTGSAVLLGLVGFVSCIPSIILAPVGGVMADRCNKKTLLLITQILAMVQALVLAILVIKGMITVYWIVALNFMLGIINAFDVAARHSFVFEMVEDKEDLGNAIALNASMGNGARLIGPLIAGLLIASVGEGICFFINSVSYIVIIIALYAMKIPRKVKEFKKSNITADFREGLFYVYRSVPMRSILYLLGLVSLTGMSYQILMPVFAKQVLGGGPHTLGFLMGAVGFGALCGAIYLASRKNSYYLSALIPVSAAVCGFGLIAVSFSRLLWLSLILAAVSGCGMTVQAASSNTLLQTLVDDDKRGRIMAFYAMAIMGMAPFGSLIAGSLGGIIGAPHALLFSGILCVSGAFLFSEGIMSAKQTEPPQEQYSSHLALGIESSEAL